MPGKNKNNKKSKSQSEKNTSHTDIPDMKTNSSTTKTAVNQQGKINGTMDNH